MQVVHLSLLASTFASVVCVPLATKPFGHHHHHHTLLWFVWSRPPYCAAHACPRVFASTSWSCSMGFVSGCSVVLGIAFWDSIVSHNNVAQQHLCLLPPLLLLPSHIHPSCLTAPTADVNTTLHLLCDPYQSVCSLHCWGITLWSIV